MKKCGDALLLIKSIGLPGLMEGKVTPLNEALSLLQLAELNKIPLLFLESLRKFRKHPLLEAQHSRYRNKHRKTLDLIALVSSLLEESSIRYTVFKTLKPFPYTPADIDVLLWSERDLTKASQILEKRGLKPLDRDPYGLTMFGVSKGINIDLTTEVAASSFIYLDKSLLFEHVNHVEVDGFKVQTLQPRADLLAVAAHSLYKEQVYTASDYYNFALSSQHYQEALKLAERAHTKFVLETALKLTHDITIHAFGSDNSLIESLKNPLQTVDMNRRIQTGERFDLPMKYSPRTLLRGLSRKLLEDPVSRNSLPVALKSTLQPKFINRLLEHITRNGY